MKCPWCEFEGPPRALHLHLGEDHVEQVELSERDNKRFYRVTCPICQDFHEQQVKPRSKDPTFMIEFRKHIALVGFDMLINHLMAEHEDLDKEGGANGGSE